MSAKIVLDYYLEKYQTLGNTLTDISINKLSWLSRKEKIKDMKGQWVSRSYYAPNGKECVRLTYEKIIGIFNYNGVEYPDVFLGVRTTLNYMDWAGEIAFPKMQQADLFELEPVFVGDGTETVTGFSSPLQRKILKGERYAADDYLAAKNPQLYAMLYARYGNEYNGYLRTGVKDTFVSAINAENEPTILAALNNEVFGHEPMKVKELILMNLQ